MLAVPARELLGERGDVLARDRAAAARELDDREAVVEVLAEAAGARLGGEIAVRAGDDAHVDLLDAARADRLDLALLERAQQLGLHAERELADLVEDQRAAVGLGEEAAPRPPARR